jgi:hypothetical protein
MTLSFRTQQYTLSEAAEGIGDVYSGLEVKLPVLGFGDIRIETGHIFCSKSGCALDVLYLLISERQFWQVLICAGEDQSTNDSLLEEVETVIKGLTFL